MTEREIIMLAKNMRQVQKEYFANPRNYSALNRSRALERQLDAAIDEYLNPNPQMDLFG